MSLVVFVVLSLASVVLWRQVVATLLAVVVVLVVLGLAVALRGVGLLDGGSVPAATAGSTEVLRAV